MNAVFTPTWRDQKDELNLPAKKLEPAIPFYQIITGYKVLAAKDSTDESALLGRERLAFGGGAQFGCALSQRQPMPREDLQ